jgi:hypothetical protein
MGKGTVCGDCKKPVGALVGKLVPLEGVHARCAQGSKVIIWEILGEGAKKQEKKLAQNAAAGKVAANKETGGKNEFKRTGTHHDPFKTASATKSMAHFSATANAARQLHSGKS